MKIKPESENIAISPLMSVISDLFYVRYIHCSSLYRVGTYNSALKLVSSYGLPTPLADILAAALTQLDSSCCRERYYKNLGTGKLGSLLTSLLVPRFVTH